MTGKLAASASKAVDAVLGSAQVAPRTVKVPLQITLLFWAIKLTSTAMGESLADWLDGSPNILIAGVGGSVLLALFWGGSMPPSSELIGAAILIGAIALLSLAPRIAATGRVTVDKV